MKRLLSSAAALAVFVLPVAAYADTPNDASPSGHHTIAGVIRSIDGKHGLTVRVDQSLSEGVTMRRGTIISPTGLQLEPGMRVAIAGHAGGNRIEADKIVGSPDAAFVARNTAGTTPQSWRDVIPKEMSDTEGPSPMGRG